MSKKTLSDKLVIAEKEKAKGEAELVIAMEEKAELEDELIIANEEIAKREAELVIANLEKAKREAELVIANKEKAKRAAELVIAKAEKAKRAAELVIANSEKVKRAAELVIANLEKAKRAHELINADKELAYQNEEKVKRAAELVIADINKTKREAELVIAKIEKAKQIAKSIIATKELIYEKSEKAKRAAELVIADAEKAKREAALVIANIKKASRSAELIIENVEKAKRSAELVIANKELVYQKSEKAKREAELLIANVVRAKRAAELVIANIEKAKRAAELVITNKELMLAREKAKLTAELIILNKELTHQIEKREQTELALMESNEKYLKAFQSSPYLIIITRMEDGKIIEVNDTFVLLSGFTRKEALSNTTIGLDLWKDVEERNSVIAALHSGKVIKGKEFAFRKKNGEIWIGLFSAKIIHINKEPYIISSIDDITERKQAEKLLKESEQKSMSIMENSPDAIFITNQQGKYVYTNKAVSVMLGYTLEEMKSKTIADISPPNKITEYFKFFYQILNEGKGFTEIELLKNDGNYISTDLNAVLLPDGTIYGSCRDISERKKAESELIKAKEHAEESDRLKTAFLSNMSHEIRTPMNGILGYSDLLKEPGISGEEQREYINIIQKSSARMLNILSEIMDISKIESGQMEIFLHETNINEKLKDVYKLLILDANIRKINLSFKSNLSDEEAITLTDRDKLNSILTNLVKNAIKYTDKGLIEFGCERIETHGRASVLQFYVKDTGIGIPKDRQEAVFERFIQADIKDVQARQGAGLGLSISKAFVEMLGGRIWVESEVGVGSTFYFTLPNQNTSSKRILNLRAVRLYQ
jgi:PAS domain S-box-containing protein